MWWLSRVRGLQFPNQSFELPYIAALVFGAGIGAYVFGSLNLWASGMAGIGMRSAAANLNARSVMPITWVSVFFTARCPQSW